MANSQKWKPGEQVPESATYVAYDSEGHNGGKSLFRKR